MNKKSRLLLLLTVILLFAVVFTACAEEALLEGEMQESSSGAPDGSSDGTGAPDGTGTSSDGTGTGSDGTGTGSDSTGTGSSAGTTTGSPVVGGDPSHTCAAETWTVVKEMTCTTDGEEQRKCTCGAVLETRAIPAAHTLNSHEGLASTCTGEGWKSYVACTRCGYNTYEKLSPLGHDVQTHAAKKPTCREIGFSAYETCTRCDYTTYAELPTVDHSYGQDKRCIWCEKEYGGQPLAYVSNGDGTCILTGLGEYTGTALEVPFKAVNGDVVVAVAENAFSSSALTSVSFSADSRVTSIGAGAFSGCAALESVALPKSLTAIGNEAFMDCEHLFKVAISSDCALKVIGASAFRNCYVLASFTVSAQVESIGDGAFRGCRQLVEVYDLSTHLTIEAGADNVNGLVGLYAVSVLTDASTPSGVWKDASGFRFYERGNNRYLLGRSTTSSAVTLPASCNGRSYAIYAYAFYENDMLTEVTVPAVVTQIGMYAFSGCKNLESIKIDAGGALTRIEKNAFADCVLLTSFTLPTGLAYIGSEAFLGCYRLVEVYNLSSRIAIEKSMTDNGGIGAYLLCVHTDAAEESLVKRLGDYVFFVDTYSKYLVRYLGAETVLALPADCEGESYVIAQYAFYGNAAITKVTLGEKTTRISSYAFADCKALAETSIPEMVDRIDAYAFLGCDSLSSVTFAKASYWKSMDSIDSTDKKTVKGTELSDSAEAAVSLTVTYVSKYMGRYVPTDPDWSGWY